MEFNKTILTLLFWILMATPLLSKAVTRGGVAHPAAQWRQVDPFSSYTKEEGKK
jgi:hypothetical protein